MNIAGNLINDGIKAMYKFLSLIAGIWVFMVSGYAEAEVRFITDTGNGEKFTSYTCSSSYISCASPKVGRGMPCGDMYLSCVCPKNYVECEYPNVGSGVDCDGKYLSNDCNCADEFVTLCNGYNNAVTVGAESCEGKYKAENCKCPSEWHTTLTCESPKVLSGDYCDTPASYFTYYEKCKCPSRFLTCNNGGQIGAESCIEDSGIKYTTCKSDTNIANQIFTGTIKFTKSIVSDDTGRTFEVFPGGDVTGGSYFRIYQQTSSLGDKSLIWEYTWDTSTSTFSDSVQFEQSSWSENVVLILETDAQAVVTYFTLERSEHETETDAGIIVIDKKVYYNWGSFDDIEWSAV